MKWWTIGQFNSTNLYCLWPFYTWWYTIYRISCTSIQCTMYHMRQLKDLKVTPMFLQNLLIVNQFSTLLIVYPLSSTCIHRIHTKYNFISVWNRFFAMLLEDKCKYTHTLTHTPSTGVENSVPNSQMKFVRRLKWIGMNGLWWAISNVHSTQSIYCVLCVDAFSVQCSAFRKIQIYLKYPIFIHQTLLHKIQNPNSMFGVFSLCIRVSLGFQFGVTTCLIFGFSFLSLFFMPNFSVLSFCRT